MDSSSLWLLALFLVAFMMTSLAGTVPFLSSYSLDSRTLTLFIDSDFQALNVNPKNVAIEEPTLPLPRPEGPEPMRSCDFLPPPSTNTRQDLRREAQEGNVPKISSNISAPTGSNLNDEFRLVGFLGTEKLAAKS